MSTKELIVYDRQPSGKDAGHCLNFPLILSNHFPSSTTLPLPILSKQILVIYGTILAEHCLLEDQGIASKALPLGNIA